MDKIEILKSEMQRPAEETVEKEGPIETRRNIPHEEEKSAPESGGEAAKRRTKAGTMNLNTAINSRTLSERLFLK